MEEDDGGDRKSIEEPSNVSNEIDLPQNDEIKENVPVVEVENEKILESNPDEKIESTQISE